MLEHGGRLHAAARRYGIPGRDWLDLSTGINPNGWSVPAVPGEIWQRLPQDDDELIAAAQGYYGTAKLLAVSGSQAAIQSLPMLRAPSRVAIVAPCYAEHAHAWQRHGHEVVGVSAEEILQAGTTAQVVVIVNPNNPTGKLFGRDELLGLHAQLAARGGWLIVDEAFMDASPEHSLSTACPRPGLIVLRSLGKFFGLAGARVGFVLAEEDILQPLAELLGPWSVAGPSRFVAQAALRDRVWQEATRERLSQDGARLAQLLLDAGLPPSGGCSLFQWVVADAADELHRRLAQRGIFTRLFVQPHSLRFGLPANGADRDRLRAALDECRA